MKHFHLAVVIGALALGLGAYGVAVQAASKKCTSEDCACEEALRQNTVEALESFLKKYPHSVQGTSACAALGVPRGGESGSGSTEKDAEPVESSNSADGG